MTQENRSGFYRMLVVAIIVAMSAAIVLQAAPLSFAATDEGESQLSSPAYDIKPPTLSTLIADVKPAVVSIAVEKSVAPTTHFGQFPGFGGANQDWLHRFFGAPNAPGPEPYRAQGEGSGFVVDKSGIIVTNYHVIEGADKISVAFESGVRLVAQLLGSDERTDLAVLKVDTEDALPYVEFGDSDTAAVGDWVVVAAIKLR